MEKKESKVCGICNKRFSSGKAIGGHMRSHYVKLPVPPKPETKNQALDNSTELTLSPINQKTTPNFQPLKRSSPFSCLPDSDRENGFLLYPKYPTRKRSKCRRRFIASAEKNAEPKEASSASETLVTEQAARCLMRMTKDKWPESKEIKTPKMEAANKMEEKDEHTEARFKCEICPKVFQSAQGLGGHRAMHRRILNLSQEGGSIEGGGSSNMTADVDQNFIKCPFCSMLFKSAQAVGGHKKVHLHNPMVANTDTTADQFSNKSLDLNFPAPGEDEEVSQIEFSTAASRE